MIKSNDDDDKETGSHRVRVQVRSAFATRTTDFCSKKLMTSIHCRITLPVVPLLFFRDSSASRDVMLLKENRNCCWPRKSR